MMVMVNNVLSKIEIDPPPLVEQAAGLHLVGTAGIPLHQENMLYLKKGRRHQDPHSSRTCSRGDSHLPCPVFDSND
jgi:hypothetical protein